jgi:hypothetical protein
MKKIKKFNESFLGGESQKKREFDINNKNRGKYFDRYYENLENDLLDIYNKVRNNEKLNLMDIKEMMVSFEEHIELNWGEEARKNIIWNK